MSNLKKLTILHSNDMHGDFLAEQVDENLIGGVSRLSGYIGKVRAEEENVLYCVAGDMFRGSVIDSEFRGVSTIEIMNMLSPDVVTLGNHEVDYGIAHLLFIEKCAKFPIINANLHIKTNGARLFKPYHLVEMGGMKILFIGILTEQVLNQTKNDGIIGTFVDTYEAAQEVGRICDAYKSVDIDLTVLLTHIGFEADKELAARLNPAWGVDIIIGGHSHTFLDEPVEVNNIIITQAGTGTDQIGRFDVVIDTDTNQVESYAWKAIPIQGKMCPRDEALETILTFYKSQTDVKYSRMITRFKRQLTHPSRYQETALGGLLSDILRDSLGLDVMLLGSGSIRNPTMGPIVLYSDLCECFPYDDPLYMVKVTGRQLMNMIRYMLRDEVLLGHHSEFYQFSDGLEVVYDSQLRQFQAFNFEGQPIDELKLYKIGLQKYHFANFEKFFAVPLDEVIENGNARVIATSCRTILDEYMSSQQNLDHEVCGRLIIL